VGDERRCGLVDQLGEDHVDLVDLLSEADRPAGQGAQRQLRQRRHVTPVPGAERRRPLEHPEHAQVPELGTEIVGGRRDEAAHLVQRPDPLRAGRGPNDPQNPHGFDVSVPGLGFTGGVTGLRGSCRGDRVLRVALAAPAAPLPVRAVHLDHPDAVALEVAGEAGAVAPGALNPDRLDHAERGKPGEETAVPSGGGVE